MDGKKPRVAVVGAGVNGLSVALCLKETYGDQLDVTVIAEKLTPNTTSDRAGCFLLSITNMTEWIDDAQVKYEMKYGGPTFRRLERVYNSPSREASGLKVFTMYYIFTKKVVTPPWAEDYCYDFKEISQAEAREKGLRFQEFETIFSFSTFLIPGMVYLSWMTKEICDRGGKIQQRKIEDLRDLNDYDIAINCTGLGALELVNDSLLYPARGQMAIINAPGYERGIYCPDRRRMICVLPYDDGKIRIGGTFEAHNWSTVPDLDVVQEIHKRCVAVDPQLEGTQQLESYACLRVIRKEVRLELEELSSGPTVIHNYGHSCNGMIMSWGFALEVARLLEETLQMKGFTMTPL